MIKQEGWERRLFAVVEGFEGVPFKRYEADCIALVGACLRGMSGEEETAFDAAVPEYHDDDSAMKAIKGLGKGGIPKGLSELFEEIPSAMAQRGDIVWLGRMGDRLPGVAICLGQEAATMAPKLEGVVLVPMDDAKKAWRVP